MYESILHHHSSSSPFQNWGLSCQCIYCIIGLKNVLTESTGFLFSSFLWDCFGESLNWEALTSLATSFFLILCYSRFTHYSFLRGKWDLCLSPVCRKLLGIRKSWIPSTSLLCSDLWGMQPLVICIQPSPSISQPHLAKTCSYGCSFPTERDGWDVKSILWLIYCQKNFKGVVERM